MCMWGGGGKERERERLKDIPSCIYYIFLSSVSRVPGGFQGERDLQMDGDNGCRVA